MTEQQVSKKAIEAIRINNLDSKTGQIIDRKQVECPSCGYCFNLLDVKIHVEQCDTLRFDVR